MPPLQKKPRQPRKRPAVETVNDKLINDLKRNVDKIIDILPKESVHSLFFGQLSNRDLGLQSAMLDRATTILAERAIQFDRKAICKHEFGVPPNVKWVLYRLNSEGELKPVGEISEQAARAIDVCG